MANTLSALGDAAGSIFGSHLILVIVLGAVLGIIFGVIPGLNAPILLSLMIPLTITMDASNALLLLGAALGGTTFAGAITSILFGVPGTGNNIATVLDGYPLGKKGRGAEAIAAAAASSFLGAFFGFVVLIILIPFLSKLVVAFGPPEIFWVSLLGIFLISVAAKESMFKGLLSGGIGLLLSTHGFSSSTGLLRFTFGVDYLWNGFNTTVVVLGLFGIAEVFNMIISRKSISEGAEDTPVRGSLLKGIGSVFKHFGVVVRSSIIGMIVGIIPGAGAGIADTVAYVAAKKSSKHPETFGTGDIVGVIAPESSNNAKDAGALVPLLTFGIPGSLAVSIILGAFILHGITPGPTMLTENLPISMILVLSVLIGGLLSTILGVCGLPAWKAVTKIPVSYLFAFVLGVSILGIYGANGRIEDVAAVLIFGVLGYFMIRFKINRVSLMLGFVLGSVAEKNFLQAIQISDGSYGIFFRNIVCFALIFIMVAWTFWPKISQMIKNRRSKKKENT